MTFDVNLRQNSRPEDYPGESLNNKPLFDPLKKGHQQFFYAFSFSSSHNINNKWSTDFGTKYSYSGINKKMSNHENSINNKTILKLISHIIGLTYCF